LSPILETLNVFLHLNANRNLQTLIHVWKLRNAYVTGENRDNTLQHKYPEGIWKGQIPVATILSLLVALFMFFVPIMESALKLDTIASTRILPNTLSNILLFSSDARKRLHLTKHALIATKDTSVSKFFEATLFMYAGLNQG
jgi:hypothetical protein